MVKSMNEAKIAKQVAILFLDNGYQLAYDKRFESLKPCIGKDTPYLYRKDGEVKIPVSYFEFVGESEGYFTASENLDGYLHITKYDREPRNGCARKIDGIPFEYLYNEDLSEEKAKEAAKEIFKNFQELSPIKSDIPSYVIPHPYRDVINNSSFNY